MSADPTKKPRSDAHLKNLPEERQSEIFEHCVSISLREGVKWLKEDGLDTSRSALSEFLSWYQLVNQFKGLQKDQETFIELLRGQQMDLQPEAVEQMGAAYFTTQAIKLNQPKTFAVITANRNTAKIEEAKLRLKEKAEARKDKELALAQEKFQFDAAKACLKYLPELRAIATNTRLNQKAKVEQIRLKLFGTLPAAPEAKTP